MALDLTPEQKAAGKANFEQTAGDLARAGKMDSLMVGGTDPNKPDRRDVLKAGLAAGAVVPVSAAVYYGYQSWQGNKAVKTALIGCGDEGGVLVGDHNKEYNEIVAVCDPRPSNLERIFEGEKAPSPRKGLNGIYGKDAAKKIASYTSVEELLANAKKLGVEMVVIATPLHTHDVIAKKCMDAGLHVLCEKLMARTISKCKAMTNYAKEKGLLLSVGHQRHYSTLYAHALEVLQNGILGDIKHIRAQWPRNNSWPFSASPAEREKFATGDDINGKPFDLPALRDGWCKPVPKQDAEPFLKEPQKLRDLGYDSITELVRWRLYDKTGGGLMAELGSHQLDASSIILGHVHPIAVSGIGGKFFYGPGKNDRESDDGVFVTFEFPGKNHPKAKKGGTDESDIVIVTYSSFNTNSFEDYGECVMGSRGTMIISKEAEVYLYKEPEPGKGASGGRETKVTVTGAGSGKPAMEATSTWGGGGGAAISKGASVGWDSAVRGYRTEMEHFAYCVRMWEKKGGKVDYAKNDKGEFVHKDIIPRCHGEVAMADAILALTANMAMAKKERIVFEEAWFDVTKDDVPETKHGPSKKA
ncbi:Gfo/Idh/MocA family oxidoreductase [Gemmata sp. G18]|uniref:Gfo/Idh/MocA family oxidoreductase n=1 Tax=Gemmata palustris TaxID=2822762 RepID=A0ABS5BJF6_9BACT|nr:Gfo/Idh/MocA family oxidoreductase [Gemmata palustris]MBP3953819.1 Gfo/Idh/MocA family oxidoreductase [Gemmata palustris]